MVHSNEYQMLYNIISKGCIALQYLMKGKKKRSRAIFLHDLCFMFYVLCLRKIQSLNNFHLQKET